MRMLMIAGQAGSGKDTLCHNFAQWAETFNKNILIIWNGELVREYSKTDTYFGKLVSENNQKGKLAPGFIMDMLVGTQLIAMKNEPDKIIIWNGSPRTKEDEITLTILMEYMSCIGEVVALQVSDKECLRRVNIRQAIQNREELTTKESIREKFGAYNRITRPMLHRLEKKNKYFKVFWTNGERSEEEIFDDVLKTLGFTDGKLPN